MKRLQIVLRILHKHAKGFYFRIAISYLLSFLNSFINILQPFFVMVIIDVITKDKNILAVFYICLLQSIVLVYSLITRYIEDLLSTYCSNYIILNIKKDLFAHIQTLPLSYFSTETPAKLLNRINNDTQSFTLFINGSIKGFINNVIKLCGSVFFASILGTDIIMIALFASLIYGIISFRFSKINRNIEKENSKARSDIYDTVIESLNAVDFVKAYQTEKKEIKKFTEASDKQIELSFRSVGVLYMRKTFVELMDLIVNLVMFVYGGYQVVNGNLLVGGFVAMMQYINKLKTGFTSVLLPYNGYSSAMGQIDRVIEIFQTSPECEFRKKNLPGEYKILGEIIFENVTFGYESGKNILENSSFKIKAGESVFLFGASGSGKSTIMKLLLRYIQPQKGTIYMDGNDIQKIDIVQYRRKLGTVLQEMRFFSGSIFENISYGVENITEEQIFAAAKKANIHDEILQMPNGYETQISSFQTQLSIGQRQRITLARAILRNPSLLILDEVTNSLDLENDFKIKEALKTIINKRTCIIISHDLSTAYLTDRQYLLYNKTIREVSSSDIQIVQEKFTNKEHIDYDKIKQNIAS